MTSPPTARVRRLVAAVASTAPRGGGWLFLGWDEGDRPATVKDKADLSEEAQRAFMIYRESGLWPRQVPYAELETVEYVLTGPALDFADHGDRLAQDQVQYVVLDSGGDRRDLALGELTVLEAIAQAREPWQSVSKGAGPEFARTAVPYHTVFAPHPDGPVDRGIAIVFRPTIRESGNEPAFRAFVRQTLGRLLVVDESQPPRSRKGYLEAAGQHAGKATSAGGSAVLLSWLRRLGLVDFDDNWLRGLDLRRGQLRVRALRALRAVGMLDVSDERLDDLADTRPDYNLDGLDTDALVGLAEAMFWSAKRAMDPAGRTRG